MFYAFSYLCCLVRAVEPMPAPDIVQSNASGINCAGVPPVDRAIDVPHVGAMPVGESQFLLILGAEDYLARASCA